MAVDDARQRALRRESWEALQRLHAEGRVRAIGVSNYMPWHLEELCGAPWCTVRPCVNQIELHPLLQQRETVAACRKFNIQVEAYSSLARGAPELMGAPPVTAAATAHGKTAAQVVLRWAVQKGYVVIPKSVKPERIAQNADVFGWALAAAEEAALDGMEAAHGSSLRVCWDPTTIKV
jgi:2,5-diketo-D-gluconate reductase A